MTPTAHTQAPRIVGPFVSRDFVRPVFCEIEERQAGADDEENTEQSIEHMRGLAIADSSSPIVQNAARDAWPHGPGEAWPLIAEAVHRWIRRHVAYLDGGELVRSWRPGTAEEDQVLIRPADLLAMPAPKGDCAVFSTLAASMLSALGMPRIFYRTVKADPDEPGQYSHVYVMAGDIPLDASHGPYLGWEVTQTMPVYGIRTWPLRGKMIKPLGRLGDFLDDWIASNSAATQAASDSITANLPGVGASAVTPPMIGDSSWISVLNTGLNNAAKILGARYAVPQYAGSTSAGQTIRLSDGTVVTQLPNGAASALGSTASTGLLIGAAALIAVMVLARKN